MFTTNFEEVIRKHIRPTVMKAKENFEQFQEGHFVPVSIVFYGEDVEIFPMMFDDEDSKEAVADRVRAISKQRQAWAVMVICDARQWDTSSIPDVCQAYIATLQDVDPDLVLRLIKDYATPVDVLSVTFESVFGDWTARYLYTRNERGKVTWTGMDERILKPGDHCEGRFTNLIAPPEHQFYA